jgi:hypothetical protein
VHGVRIMGRRGSARKGLRVPLCVPLFVTGPCAVPTRAPMLRPMAYFQFLGTGPVDAPAQGTGRNQRRPASALLHHISTYLLFDATTSVVEQAEQALSITHIALTGLQRSRYAGLTELDAWLESPAILYAPGAPPADLGRRAGGLRHIELQPLPLLVPTVVSDVTLTPFPLREGAAKAADALVGFHIDTGKKKITYAPSFGEIPPESAAFFDANDLLVVDGRGFARDTPSHVGALPRIADWLSRGNEAVVFTDLDADCPPHTQAQAQVRRGSHRADLAFDFMKAPLGR